MGSQLPFLFHHPFISATAAPRFAPPHNHRASPIDLTGGSQKQAPEECVTDQSKPTKKRRIQRKKPEIVELDDIKDDGDVQKNVGHWKDHWVIQLITVRGEMQSIFSAPPKQGTFLQLAFFDSFLCVFRKVIQCCTWISMSFNCPVSAFRLHCHFRQSGLLFRPLQFSQLLVFCSASLPACFAACSSSLLPVRPDCADCAGSPVHGRLQTVQAVQQSFQAGSRLRCRNSVVQEPYHHSAEFNSRDQEGPACIRAGIPGAFQGPHRVPTLWQFKGRCEHTLGFGLIWLFVCCFRFSHCLIDVIGEHVSTIGQDCTQGLCRYAPISQRIPRRVGRSGVVSIMTIRRIKP